MIKNIAGIDIERAVAYVAPLKHSVKFCLAIVLLGKHA